MSSSFNSSAGLNSLEMEITDHISEIERRVNERENLIQACLPEPERFSRIKREWQDLSTRYSTENTKPRLYGKVFGVKDIFHVEGFETRAGSRLPAEALTGAEAVSVRKLKEAGALLLGKTVTTEFAYFAPGPTRNPHNPDHTPGGSSSGSAAAVASGFCDLALGTQTIGSIIRPAAYCGVIGFKPSYGRSSAEGVIPLSPSLDHVGFFSTDISLAAQCAEVLLSDWNFPKIDRMPILGIPTGPYLASASPEGLVHFENMKELLTKSGYELHLVSVMDDYAAIRRQNDMVLSAEAAHVHAAWFGKYEKLYAQKTAELIRRGGKITENDLQNARQSCAQLKTNLREAMEKNGIDLWIAPSAAGAAPKGLESTGDPIMNLPWTQAGLPVLNLPAGTNSTGLPLGLQLIGKWYEDEALLYWAESIAKVVAQG